MKLRNNIFAGCSVVIALGAVGVGALVSSNAMAASDDPAEAEVTIGMITIAEDGSAFECTLDAADVPGFAPVEVTGTDETPLGIGGTLVVGGPAIASGGAVTASGSIVMEGVEGAVPVELGELEASGVVTNMTAPGESAGAFQVVTGEEVEPIEVRKGTDAECAAAVADAQP